MPPSSSALKNSAKPTASSSCSPATAESPTPSPRPCANPPPSSADDSNHSCTPTFPQPRPHQPAHHHPSRNPARLHRPHHGRLRRVHLLLHHRRTRRRPHPKQRRNHRTVHAHPRGIRNPSPRAAHPPARAHPLPGPRHGPLRLAPHRRAMHPMRHPLTPKPQAREGTAEAPGRYLAFHTAHTYGQYTVLCPKCAPATDAPLTALTAEDLAYALAAASPNPSAWETIDAAPAEPPIKSSNSTSPPPKICWSTLSKPSGRSRRKPPQNNTRSARPCAPCHGKIANSTPGLYLAHI